MRFKPWLDCILILPPTCICRTRRRIEFTVFSPFYARVIAAVGLENAARSLTLLFTAWFLAAAWSLIRAMTSREAAWLAVALLLIVAGNYGGSGVFRISETYLTARLPAEALVVTALACHVRGRGALGLLLAMGALFIHPLIALPGLLLLRVSAVAEPHLHCGCRRRCVGHFHHGLHCGHCSVRDSSVDRDGFGLVGGRERTLAILVPDTLVGSRLECECAAVFLSGLHCDRGARLKNTPALPRGGTGGSRRACSGNDGQRHPGRDIGAGPGVALGMDSRIHQCRAASGHGLACMARPHLRPAVRDAAGVGLGMARGRWDGLRIARADALAGTGEHRHADCSLAEMRIRRARYRNRGVDGDQILVDLVASIRKRPLGRDTSSGHFRIENAGGAAVSYRVVVDPGQAAHLGYLRYSSQAVIALAAYILPAAFKQSSTFGSSGDVEEFADWINVIPPTSTVLVAPARDVGAFVWFTLSRPNYLALDQSAGVVFSRATALEIKRRSEVLLPLMEPNWKIWTSLRAKAINRGAAAEPVRPLTAERLIQICADPQLGFVVSPQEVGFGPLRHAESDSWKDWNLYDCRKVRSALSSL